MEIINSVIGRITKKCICSYCGSELLVSVKDVDQLGLFQCPLCKYYSRWITKNERKVISQIDDEEKELISDLEDIIPKRFHEVMERIVSAHIDDYRRALIKSNMIKEDQ